MLRYSNLWNSKARIAMESSACSIWMAKQNIPTWFQSTGLLVCSFLLAAGWSNAKKSGFCRHWGMFSLIFLVLSLDEVACIHEGLGNVLSHALHTSGFFEYAWVIPGGIFTLIVFISSLRFLQHLPAHPRKSFIIAGAVYVSGTLGWEMMGGWYDTLHGSRNMTYMTLTVLEEAFESAGIVLFIRALLVYLKEFSATRPEPFSSGSSSHLTCHLDLSVQD